MIEPLGAGGCGVVYKVEHLLLGQVFALKLPRAGPLTDAVARKRFTREARAVCRWPRSLCAVAYDNSVRDDAIVKTGNLRSPATRRSASSTPSRTRRTRTTTASRSATAGRGGVLRRGRRARDAAYGFRAFLVRTKKLLGTPSAAIVETLRRRPWTAAEFRALLRAVPNALRAVCYLVAVITGLRKSELRRMRRGDLDLERTVVVVRPEVAKTRKEKVIPILPELATAIRWLVRNDEGAQKWLFDVVEDQLAFRPLFPSVPRSATVARGIRSRGRRRSDASSRGARSHVAHGARGPRPCWWAILDSNQ